MPRQARLDIVGLVHHVMARGIEGRDIFRDDEDRERFVVRLEKVIAAGVARLYAWCLMPNHFHLLVRPERVPLSSLMRRLMTGYAVVHNLRHRRKGHLFQNRYKSIVVEEEPYFLELVRYIHLNPLRGGVVATVEDLDDWPFTGHAVLMGRRVCDAQDRDEVLLRFGAKQGEAVRAYQEFVAGGVAQGRREELRGGGLVRSAGGVEAVRRRRAEEREAADERILGGGEFVEGVLDCVPPARPAATQRREDLLGEVAERHGIEPAAVLGTSRGARCCRARREYLLRAVEEAGASVADLAREWGHSYTAAWLAIAKARAERAAEAGPAS